MKNLTTYNDQFILGLIEQVKGNPHKCTANVQYAVGKTRLIPVLVIYQDYSTDWNYDDRPIFCEEVSTIEFCDEFNISLNDLATMVKYYDEVSFQDCVMEEETLYEMYLDWLAQTFC